MPIIYKNIVHLVASTSILKKPMMFLNGFMRKNVNNMGRLQDTGKSMSVSSLSFN